MFLETCDEECEILNVVDRVGCIDEPRSQFTKWTPEDGRLEKTGDYRMVTHLQLNSRLANSHHLFRVTEWPVALIASEQVKSLLEDGTTGLRFEPVN